MACYVDTSVWMALLGRESSALAIEQWMMRGLPLATSAWTAVEIASGLGIKARRGDLSQGQVSQTCEAFRGLLGTGGVEQVACTGLDFSQAALLCEHVAGGLRSGDALHLAVAQRVGSTLFFSFDKTLSRQAQQMGFGLVNVSSTD